MARRPRYNMQVEIPESARQSIDKLHEQTGLPKVQLVARLFEWFADQDEFLQLSMLNMVSPELQQDVAKMKLEQMARGEGTRRTIAKISSEQKDGDDAIRKRNRKAS